MAKPYKSRTQEELVSEIQDLKKELQLNRAAFKRIEAYAKAGNFSAVKSSTGNALRRN